MATHSSILAWRILHDTTEKDPVCPKRPGTAKSIHKHFKKRKKKKMSSRGGSAAEGRKP